MLLIFFVEARIMPGSTSVVLELMPADDEQWRLCSRKIIWLGIVFFGVNNTGT